MINDPTTLLALALCVGILGLVVLILPLLILFWSQMEPQLAGVVGGEGDAEKADDEYGSQAVLPRLMKSFGDMAELEKEAAAKKSSRKASSKAKSRKTSTSTSRSQASAISKTIKAAPAKRKKAAASKTAKTKAKSGEVAPSKKKKAEGVKKASAKKATAKSTNSKAAKKRTPAGAKRDPILGVVYSKKPKEIDDLKEIKGVAKVIEGKLHKSGIYTFRQIVEWDSAAIDAFSDKLAFKGRVRNEDWQKQCAKLHKSKYDEKI